MPPTCGICICSPALQSVGICAATQDTGTPVCGSITTASCGMPVVSINATKPTIWPWVVAIGVGLWLLSKRHRG